MPERAAALRTALAAVAKPLHFAASDGFAHLERVVGLETTLRKSAAELRKLVTGGPAQTAVDALVAELGGEELPRGTRIQALERCLARLSVLEEAIANDGAAPAGLPAPESIPPVAPPAAARQPAHLTLQSPVKYVRGVGPKLAELLNAHEIKTVGDLLHFLPRRYEDRRAIAEIRELQDGVNATVEGEVLVRSERRYRGRVGLDVALGDSSGVLHLCWFRVPGHGFADRFQKGRRIRASGQVRAWRGKLQIVHPETMLVSESGDTAELADAVVPIYPEIEGFRPAQLRRVVHAALPAARELVEVLPAPILHRRHLPALGDAVRALHQPPPEVAVEALNRSATHWHQRLIYEELFLVQLAVLRRRALARAQPGHAVPLGRPLVEEAARLFPFRLTGAQGRVLADIDADLRRAIPMNRLLQGDVGSGKTAVAVAAAAGVARAGYQAAIMAPTELLAEQHARVALTTLASAGFRVALLTGAVTGSERRQILEELAVGRCQVIVGTHALIQDEVRFHRLAFAVVDEQHRFGVRQRARLLAMGREGLASNPHMLVMTATPIPRTLALTVYGDLDLSLVDELPPGRKAPETRLYRDKERDQVYARVRQAVDDGRQAYVVFPLVEESDAEGLEHVRDATSAAAELEAGPLAGVRVGLLHGRMSSDDKDRVMRAFVAGHLQVLVATTVIEVGIDVANATVMVVEHAERFGLSQLHQLRGRVGRGAHQGLCLLVARYTQSEDAWRRLKIMERTSDGFRIAEEDLEIRGPGDFLGTRQSGVPLLSVANLARDQRLLQQARDDAAALLEEDPDLALPQHRRLADKVAAIFVEKLDLVQVG
ncbi:MAG: ATP-dependent DNA helicase RecG [Deltaproteobacteria bacterium]|nr:ATP-dependent DNA helicase RecG [Deltaproteobacteria bacterium]